VELYGSLTDNLRAAILSAKKHNGHPVRTGTLLFWADLPQHARSSREDGNVEAMGVDPLTAQLDHAVTARL
jgi:hypothetical protein